MTNLADRRVQKTRQLLQKAVVDLVIEKGFEAITVQDILDKANVGRSTFYSHYQDKGELLHSCFDELNVLLGQHAINLSDGSRNSPDLVIITDFTFNLFKFAERNGQLFKALFKQQNLSEFVHNFLFDRLNDPLKRRMAREKNSSIPSEIVTNYFINAFLGILKWWVSNDMPCTAEEIDRYFKQLVMPSIKSVILANR